MAPRARVADRASATVLVVDRDAAARATARRMLESDGYRVLDAGDAAGAEQLATLYVGPIHALVVDVDVDVTAIGAPELAERLRRLRPEMRVLLTSENPRRRPSSGTPTVRKPFTKRRLLAALRALVGRR
jgi:CheY-like chemotaxis protein